MGLNTSMVTMDTFGGKDKAASSTASLATTTTFSLQQDEDEYERIRQPSHASLASASSRASEVVGSFHIDDFNDQQHCTR
jgi:hypothetical protein